MLLSNQHFLLSAKMNGTQRRTLVHISPKNALYVLPSMPKAKSMPKGTCWAKTTLNSEKIKPVALAVIKLCLSEGISQSVRQSVESSVATS